MKNIVFGMPSLIELPDIETHAKTCVSLGLSFIELNMNFPIFQIHAMDIRQYRRVIEKNNLSFTLHLDENFDICAYNRPVARAWMDTMLQAVTLAKQLEIPVINMHLPEGIYVTLPGNRVYLYERNKDEYLFLLRDFRDKCTQWIGEDQIQICVENNFPYREYQKDAIDLLLESYCFGLTYDIGHDHLTGGGTKSFIMSRASHLRHMHIHDATHQHNHLPLGTGEISLHESLYTAETHGCRCVVETKTVESLTDSVAYLRRNDFL